MSSLERDLRYALAPLHARAVYALLFGARREIVEVLRLGHDHLTIASRVLGVERAEAEAQLEELRKLGLVGDGLTLLAGVRGGRRAQATTGEGDSESVRAVRAALAEYTGSRRALARELGCSSAALDRFVSGEGTIGVDLLSALAARLPTNTRQPNAANQTLPTNAASVGTTSVGTWLAGDLPSDSPLFSPSEALSSPAVSKENEAAGIEGVGSGEREHSAAAANQTPTAAREKPRRERRPKPAPAVDIVPPEGTVARRVYEAITTDVALAPITRGPGNLSMRLAALCDGTTVDPAAEVILAGAWQARNCEWTDGAAALLRWVKRSADKARSLPAPVVGTPRTTAQPAKIDYQGRRVVGAAGLPPGSVWEKTKEQHEAEEDALYARAYAATQPKKGAVGR